MTPPLQGIRILDLAGERGAYGLRLLADLGGEVVKVEPPGGDLQRRRPPLIGSGGESLAFAYYNAGKRSVVVEPDGPDTVEVLQALAAGVDVVAVTLTSDRTIPGWDAVSRRPTWAPPHAIVCVFSDFGVGGPDDHLRATHFTSFAHSGQMWTFGPPAGPPEAIPGRPFYDELSAHAAAAILAALRLDPSVRPSLLEFSVHDLLAWRDTVAFTLYGAARVAMIGGRTGAGRPGVPPSGVWPTKDGLVEFLVYNPPHWDGFAALFPEVEALRDPELRVRAVRADRAAELGPLVAELIAARTTAEIVESAQANRIPCAQLATPLDVTRDPQLADRGFFVPAEVSGTTVSLPGRPFRSDPALWTESPSVPALGGHRAEPEPSDPSALPALPAVSAVRRQSVPAGRLLEGVRVLTFGTAIAGNVSASMLAELGADVVKIEAPDRPDPLRTGPINAALPRIYEPSGVETNFMFAGYSRSGRSLGLNMKKPEDQAVFLDLLATADVLIDNFATGVMAGWGLPPERLRAQNPSLVWVSVSGFGRTGPRSHYMAYGSNINSFLGFTRMWAPHGTQFDYSAVAHVMLAVQAGLRHRDQTGEGTSFDIAQVEAGIAVLAPLYLDALATAQDGWSGPNEVPGAWLSGVYPAAGVDEWVAVELENEVDAARLAELLAVADTGRDLLVSGLTAWLGQRSADDAERTLQRSGVAAAKVRKVEDLYGDAQLWGRDGVQHVDHIDLGPMRVPSAFLRVDGQPPRVVRPSARLGEHREEILADWLAPTGA